MKTSFNKRSWERLLTGIEEQKVIPIIGPELLIMEIDGVQTTFYQHLAGRLADNLEVDTAELVVGYSLNEVAELFLAEHGDPADIYFEIRQIVAETDWPIPIPLRQLAGIHHFRLFLSITFDPFMKQALDLVRFNNEDRTTVIAYSNMGRTADLPAQQIQSSQPLVFQLFGQVSSSPDYVVTDDDLLRFNHQLQSRTHRPANLFDLLKNSSLLSLGCNLPDWLARFFFCAAKGDLLFSQLGMGGMMADNTVVDDKKLSSFLVRNRTLLYNQGDAVKFTDELFSRWTERFPESKAVTSQSQGTGSEDADLISFPDEAVFLSYASEDRVAAIRIREALEQAGIDVWFDQKKLEAGDDYRLKIFRNIENSSFFLPILSGHTVTMNRRFFRLEWHKALEEQQFRPREYPFIQPIVIDDTPPDAPYIPDEFKTRHWQNFPDGAVAPEFVELTRKRIKELRRMKRRQR